MKPYSRRAYFNQPCPLRCNHSTSSAPFYLQQFTSLHLTSAVSIPTTLIFDPSTNPLTTDTTIQATVAKPLHAANGRQPPMSVAVSKLLELAWIFMIW
ncbi:unnamed protein product [Vicia faba]|uniref:Uncharacterized protein n=1 Tax=Vicia faba TaxID=3906 RepID=A0AAV1B520_VICFA|nr:unnamed protein product [Vicia faba]